MTQQFDPNLIRRIAPTVTQTPAATFVQGVGWVSNGQQTLANDPFSFLTGGARVGAPPVGASIAPPQTLPNNPTIVPQVNAALGYGGAGQPPPPPDAQGFTNPGAYGYGNFSPEARAMADYYSQMGQYYTGVGAPQLQRTSVDWTGYGSGQGPAPNNQMGGYPQYGGTGGTGGGGAGTGSFWSQVAAATKQMPQTGGPSAPSGGFTPSSGVFGAEPATPNQRPTGGTGGLPGGGIFGADPTGLPPSPTVGGGVRPKSMMSADAGAPTEQMPQGPPTGSYPGYATGGVAFGQRAGAQGGAQGLVEGRPAMTPGNQGATANSFVPGQPYRPPTPGGYGGPIASVGQYANPVFQQQQMARGQQQDLISRLQGDVEGRGPSLAELTLRRGADANVANAQALAASGGPNNAAMAQRQAMQTAAREGQNLAGQSAELRAKEYQSAIQNLSGAINQGRLNDLQAQGMSYDNAFRQAQLEQSQNQQQAQLEMQQRQLGLQGGLGYGGMANDVRGQDLGSRMHYLDLMAQKYANDRGLQQQAQQYEQGRSDKWLGAGLNAAGTLLPLLLASDERLKTDVKEASKEELSDFLGKLKGRKFRYKNGDKFGDGEMTGVMAQDVEKSAVGKRIVVETKDGKMLDVRKAVSALLAAGASQEGRLRRLEGRK